MSARRFLRDDAVAAARVQEIADERARLTTGLRDAGWAPEPSTTNFLLVDFATAEAADAAAEALLSRGLIPRTFPAGHPLAHCLRLTVRNREQDDRLIEAARELASG